MIEPIQGLPTRVTLFLLPPRPPDFQARGDVPSLSFAPAETFTGTVTISTAGSLEGIAPLWGTFELGYGGEITSPLYADATAGK